MVLLASSFTGPLPSPCSGLYLPGYRDSPIVAVIGRACPKLGHWYFLEPNRGSCCCVLEQHYEGLDCGCRIFRMMHIRSGTTWLMDALLSFMVT